VTTSKTKGRNGGVQERKKKKGLCKKSEKEGLAAESQKGGLFLLSQGSCQKWKISVEGSRSTAKRAYLALVVQSLKIARPDVVGRDSAEGCGSQPERGGFECGSSIKKR